jgi:hypothetical protein
MTALVVGRVYLESVAGDVAEAGIQMVTNS